MILKKIQSQIETLYQFRLNYDVERFLLSFGRHEAREILLVKQTKGVLELGLFFEASILKTLRRRDPFLKIGRENLQAFCVAIEGVSHFLYLLKHALEEHPVTRLELELQGEVDKYLLTALLFFDQRQSVPPFLFGALFEEIRWDARLGGAEKRRYEEANRFALRFCRHLEEDYLRQGRWRNALDEARHFYSLNHWEKIRKLIP